MSHECAWDDSHGFTLDVNPVGVQVYEHLVFEGSEHVSLRSLPGMHDRCIRVGSAGKTFSLTAWKVCCCILLN